MAIDSILKPNAYTSNCCVLYFTVFKTQKLCVSGSIFLAVWFKIKWKKNSFLTIPDKFLKTKANLLMDFLL